MWWLYLRVQTQWRIDAKGMRIGLDYGPAIAIIQHRKWDLSFVLELLQIVERQALKPETDDDN